MVEQRRRFSPQFKAEAVQMVIETGKPIAQVARDLGIHDGTLGNWVNAYRHAHPEPDEPLSPVERARVKEMEDEIRRLRMENECGMTADGLSTDDAQSRPPRSRRKVAKLGDDAWLRQRYLIEGASISTIAAELGC